MNNKFEDIYNILKQDKRIVSEDGNILKNKLSTLAMNMDENLLNILISNDITKDLFFKEIDNILVFDKIKFSWTINSKDFLPDSYTAFKNKIMLVDDSGESIKNSSNIVLSFPFKDCVLEADSTKETDKRNEIFFNETLMKREIDTLLAPKIFTNAKKHSIEGEEKINTFQDNDNLIIKGNNLLALYSLIPRYKSKIKCMYWDILYNTNNDQVPYNDSFKHTSWLTMIKNRLEVAKELLDDKGCICIQINDGEKDYLKVLMDEIFSRSNYVATISVRTKSLSGFQSVNPGVFKTAEYIMIYSKNKTNWNYNLIYSETDYDKNYKWYILNKQEHYSKWKIEDVKEYVSKLNGCKSSKDAKEKFGEVVLDKMVGEFALEHSDSLFQSTAIGDNAGKEIKELRDKSKINKDVVFELKRDKYYNIYIYNGREMAFYSKKIRNVNGKMVPSMQITNIWNDIAYEGIASEGEVKLKKGKKPEMLIKRIIEMCTNPGDIVLDAYLGSGTTASVAHKMGRQYIGIEQLNSHYDMSIQRIENVINGDKTGISKSQNWKGGGSFVSCELKTLGQSIIDKIIQSNSLELNNIYTELKHNEFVTYRVNINKLEENQGGFDSLTEDEQRKFLIEIIDKNMLYVNYSEIEDESYNISEEDKEFNRSFYE